MALLGFLGGVGGVLIGVVGVKILVTTPAIRGLLEPDLNAQLLVMAVAIAVVVRFQRSLSRLAEFSFQTKPRLAWMTSSPTLAFQLL